MKDSILSFNRWNSVTSQRSIPVDMVGYHERRKMSSGPWAPWSKAKVVGAKIFLNTLLKANVAVLDL